MKTFFMTGTDTDAGKTVASSLILKELNNLYHSTLALKPISAGCEMTSAGLRNEDALTLQEAANIEIDYELVNPIAFEPPIAPHIAASNLGRSIELSDLQDSLEEAKKHQASCILIEGAGGWRLPLNNNGLFLSDFVIQNQIPVVLVVGMKLGCLNHAILTHQAILRDGLTCVGWVANQLSDDMLEYDQNKQSLIQILSSPLLAEIPFQPKDINQINLTEAFLKVFT
ncbi:dethiobiotin synthase [Glaciecola petra]|uniref:ATP-dependent dethiobiotin synthetase BioD n=1 Tax=Glaciecola petra TaxID=3075602 RepID=A0ABU2ZRG8_9ALTE|nr:dethiobiotin synthase [Aestuariibacter sp. P117]MDT0594638.1 dethiobiotin synthase [Aestuariibacter sp. P117]